MRRIIDEASTGGENSAVRVSPFNGLGTAASTPWSMDTTKPLQEANKEAEMFVGYQRLTVGNTVSQFSSVATIPAGTVRAQIQADTANIHYTMDNSTNPTSTSGMRLIVGPPEWFEIQDLKRMRMISAGSSSGLNVHYYAPDHF